MLFALTMIAILGKLLEVNVLMHLHVFIGHVFVAGIATHLIRSRAIAPVAAIYAHAAGL